MTNYVDCSFTLSGRVATESSWDDQAADLAITEKKKRSLAREFVLQEEDLRIPLNPRKSYTRKLSKFRWSDDIAEQRWKRRRRKGRN